MQISAGTQPPQESDPPSVGIRGVSCRHARAEPARPHDRALRPDIPAERLHGLVVDCAGAAAQARWWGNIYGVEVTENDGWWTLEGVPGMPIQTMDFVSVPEPKTVKNRIHWDVAAPDVAPLIDAGAKVLREPGGDIRWHVLADPEGNEFCVFTQ
jgi:hypothetical protein